MDKHHRKPKAQGGKSNRRNISYLTKEEHEAWHKIFNGHRTPEEIADILTRKFIDPDYFMVAIKRR